MKIAVLGAGAWGTALAIALSGRHDIRLLARDPDLGRALNQTRTNVRYLPGARIPDAVGIVTDSNRVLEGADLALVAVPIAGLRETLRTVGASARVCDVVWLCKGFESASAKFPHQVAAEELPANYRYAALSGPSFADEVANGLPTAVTLASNDANFSLAMAHELHTGRLRVYSSGDLPGVETGGAVKNVMAIAAGVSDGLRLGASARAALITRGLAEITRLGLRLGGRLETFMGLAGMGDLVLTATSDLSRNRQVGLQLAAGKPLPEIVAGLGHVAEGVSTAREVRRLAAKMNIEMPITQTVCKLLDGAVSARGAVDELLQREPGFESRQLT